ADAAPGARRRGPHRAQHRRPGLLHVRARRGGGRMSSATEGLSDLDTGPGRLASRLDTVELAATTPDDEQPFAELGLRAEEYQRIKDILGRRPTTAELAMYSV